MNEHAPQLSIWPILVAFALTLMAIGVLSTWIVAVLGILLLLYTLWAWVQENRVTGHPDAHPVIVEVEDKRHE